MMASSAFKYCYDFLSFEATHQNELISYDVTQKYTIRMIFSHF